MQQWDAKLHWVIQDLLSRQTIQVICVDCFEHGCICHCPGCRTEWCIAGLTSVRNCYCPTCVARNREPAFQRQGTRGNRPPPPTGPCQQDHWSPPTSESSSSDLGPPWEVPHLTGEVTHLPWQEWMNATRRKHEARIAKAKKEQMEEDTHNANWEWHWGWTRHWDFSWERRKLDWEESWDNRED